MKQRLSRDLSKKVKQESAISLAGWAGAIIEAESRIAAHRARIELLTLSLERFKESRDSGEPWPGTGESEAKAA